MGAVCATDALILVYYSMVLFIVSFIAGVLTVLAPCVLPLLPVVLAGSVSETTNRRRPAIIIGALSVSVFVFTLILKGSTALLGASPTFWSYISAIILFAFGLTLLFPEAWARLILRIPGHNKPDRWITRGYGRKSSFWTDVIVGAALGPVFTTCSPTFFVILATVLPASLGMGILDLLAYIIGLALMLLLVAFIGQRIIDRLGWATDPRGWFRKVLGILFIGVAITIVFGWDKRAESAILNSGYFDVTAIEQSIHQSLTGGGSATGPGGLFALPTASSSPSSSAAASSAKRGNYVEIADPAGFVNSAPFKLSDFVGKKVILLDFIDYSCINCERTFPYLEQWWNEYQSQGLEVIAIHTPEFAFEKSLANVQAAAKQFGLTFPIVLDNDYATWNAYQNEYWPHKYLIDIHGNVVYDKIGEGGDDEVEAQIVKQLQIRDQVLGLPDTVTSGAPLPEYTVQAESPETYFGAMRNDYFGNGTPAVTGDITFVTPATLSPDMFYLGGPWHIDQEYAQEEAASTTLSYIFTASKMYMVAATADGSPVTATILIDGHSIPATWEGADVVNSVLTITGSRLYSLYSNPTVGEHRIDIIFSKPGAQVYTFTFG